MSKRKLTKQDIETNPLLKELNCNEGDEVTIKRTKKKKPGGGFTTQDDSDDGDTGGGGNHPTNPPGKP